MNTTLRIGLIIISLVLSVVLIVKFLFPYLMPFLLAILLAVLIDPVVDWLEEKLRLRRGFAVLIVLLVVLLVLITLLALLVNNVTHELEVLIKNVSDLNVDLNRLLSDLAERLENFTDGFAGLPAPINSLLEANAARLSTAIQNVAQKFLDILVGAPGFLFDLLIASIATFFISRDKNVFFSYFLGLVPRRFRPNVLRVKTEVATGIVGFLRSQLVLISMTGILSIIGLTFLQVRYAWLLGILAGLLDLIPMIGPSGVFIPIIVYNLVTGNFLRAALLGGVLGIILLIRQLSEPRIVGKRIGLHPLTSLLAIYLGTRLLGVNGFIIGPLVVIFLKAIIVVVILPMLPKE